jgi:exopolysaccharide production protein ExoQ
MTTSNISRQFGPINAGRVIGAAMALMLPIALLAPKGIAPLFGISAILVIGLTFNRHKLMILLPLPISAVIGGIVVFTTISSFWSVTPGETFYSSLMFALTCIGGLAIAVAASRLTVEDRDFVEIASIYGGAFGLALFFFEYSSGGALKQYIFELIKGEIYTGKLFDPARSSGVAVYVLYIWPMMVAINRRLGAVYMALSITVIIIVVTLGRADSPAIALGTGLAVAVAAIFSKRIIVYSVSVFVVVGIAAMPFLPEAMPNPETETHRLSFLSPSALHRLSIWNTAAERLKEKPMLGIGMNATRSLYSDKDKILRVYYADVPDKKWHNLFEPIPLHVHNGILQIWLELGIGGALLLGAIILSLLRLILDNCQNPIWTAASLGLIISAIVIFSLSFGPWQSWWQATLWLSAGFMVAVRDDSDIAEKS